MPFPERQNFESFLAGCELTAQKPDGRHVHFEAPRHHFDPAGYSGRRPDLPDLFLKFPAMDLTVESVATVIERHLSSANCAANRDIALSVLALLAATREPTEPAVPFANRCLSQMHETQLHQVVVLPSPYVDDRELSFGEISFKRFDPDKILYWADRGAAEYPFDLTVLRGRACLERSRFATRLIDWERIPGAIDRLLDKWGDLVACACISDPYYQAVYDYHLAELPDVLSKEVRILEAGALVHVDAEGLVWSSFSSQIGLFTWRGSERKRSWALLHAPALFINLIPVKTLTDSREWLASGLGFDGRKSTNPLSSLIDAYCAFLQRAQTHRLAGRRSDAFLHFVIAIDLLLGETSRSSESVSERAAVLVHRQFDRSLRDQIRSIKNLYNRRSKYVHEGLDVDESIANEAEQVSLEILWALLSASRSDLVADSGEWLARLDYILAAQNAQKPVSEDEFRAIGVPPLGTKRIPPNYVRPDAEATRHMLRIVD